MHSQVVSIKPETAFGDIVNFAFIGEVGWFAVFSVVFFKFLFCYFFCSVKKSLLYLRFENLCFKWFTPQFLCCVVAVKIMVFYYDCIYLLSVKSRTGFTVNYWLNVCLCNIKLKIKFNLLTFDRFVICLVNTRFT